MKKTLSVAHNLLRNRWENAKSEVRRSGSIYYPDRNDMEREVRQLVELETNDWKKKYVWFGEEQITPEEVEHKKELLQVFREVFDWETKYELLISYYTEPNSYTHEHKCKDAEELKKYLNYQLDFDIEEVDDDDIDYDRFDYSSRIEGEDHNRRFDITITKFRLKEEVQKEEVQEVSER